MEMLSDAQSYFCACYSFLLNRLIYLNYIFCSVICCCPVHACGVNYVFTSCTVNQRSSALSSVSIISWSRVCIYNCKPYDLPLRDKRIVAADHNYWSNCSASIASWPGIVVIGPSYVVFVRHSAAAVNRSWFVVTSSSYVVFLLYYFSIALVFLLATILSSTLRLLA